MYQSIKQKLTTNKPSGNDVKPGNYSIEVKAIEGRNLMVADSNGFSDPYLKLCIRSEDKPRKVKTVKTKYIRKTLNPTWNESFILTLENPQTDFLHVECWDKDFIKPDDPIGYTHVKLNDLEQGKEYQLLLKLVSVDTGEILISIRALNFTSTPLPDINPLHSTSLPPSGSGGLTNSSSNNNNPLDPSTFTQTYSQLPPPPSVVMCNSSIPPPLTSPIDPDTYTQTYSMLPAGGGGGGGAPPLTSSLPSAPTYSNNNSNVYDVSSSFIPPSVQTYSAPPAIPSSLGGGGGGGEHHSLYQTASAQGFDIDYYQIKFISRIGSGAFGEVWKGEWAGTTVAIKKILKTDISEDDLKEFSREILLMSKLRHPNVVQFLGACIHPEFCLLTEFMERGSLYNVLANETIELAWAVRVQIATDIAKGMLYLHTRTPPIIHRDIKSLNILVTKDWKATISDFGLTRIKEKTTGNTNKADDNTIGSPAWSAPEVLRSEEYSEKVDVYSFAIVLWEIITRKTPYENLSNPMQLIGQVAYQKPSLRPPIPEECPLPELVKLMVSCWSDSPDDRPDFKYIHDKLKTIDEST